LHFEQGVAPETHQRGAATCPTEKASMRQIRCAAADPSRDAGLESLEFSP
jgi:hypothetical protein